MTSNRVVSLLLALIVLGAVGVPVAQAAGGTQTATATVDVDPPRWTGDTVRTVQEGNKTIHIVPRGSSVEVSLKGINTSAVTEFGLSSESGALTYDSEEDQYVLSTTTSGTYELFWVVNEQQTRTIQVNNSTRQETQVVTTRYTAHVRIDSASYTHVTSGEYEQTQAQAENWTAWAQSVREVSSAETDAEVKQEGNSGLSWIKFTNRPLAFLTGDFFGLTLALLTSPQGLFIVAILLGINLPALIALWRYRNRRETLDPEEMTLDDKLDEFHVAQVQQAAEGTPLADVFSNPETAAKLRHAMDADSYYTAFSKYMSLFVDHRLLRDRLSVMGNSGYRAAVQRDGDDIIDAYVLASGDDPSDGYAVEEMTEPSEELADALEDDDEVWDVHLPDLAGDSTVDVQPVEYDLETITKKVDEQIGTDVGTQQRYGRYLLEMMDHTRKSNITDSEGRVKPMRLMINDLLRLMWKGDDMGIPLARIWSEHLRYLLDTSSVESEVEEKVERVQDGDFSRGD